MEIKEEKGTVTVTETTTRKVCSRASGHVTKNTVEVAERKYAAHSGIKFNFDSKKKVTKAKPFSFDTGPKIKKEKAFPPSPVNPGGKQKDSGSRPKVTKEYIKVTKETRTRSTSPKSPKSGKRQANSPNKATTPVKSLGNLLKPTISSAQKLKPQVHYTNADEIEAKVTEKGRESSNDVKPEDHNISNVTKSLEHLLKPTVSSSQKLKPHILHSNEVTTEVKVSEVKEERCESSSTEKSQGHVSNAPKSLEHLLKPTISYAQKLKPHIHFSNEDVSEVKVSEKGCESSNADKSKPDVPKNTKPIPDTARTEEIQIKLPNGVELKSELPETGTGPLSELPNGLNINCEYSETKIVESSMTKTASKIPRKKYGAHSGLKFHPAIRKETIPQPFSFESRCSNMKKENMHFEANQMKITNIVNN